MTCQKHDVTFANCEVTFLIFVSNIVFVNKVSLRSQEFILFVFCCLNTIHIQRPSLDREREPPRVLEFYWTCFFDSVLEQRD